MQAFESQLNRYYDGKLSKVSSEIGNAKYKAVKTDTEKSAKEIERNFGQDWKASTGEIGFKESIQYALKEYQKLIDLGIKSGDDTQFNEALSVSVAGALNMLTKAKTADIDMSDEIKLINKYLDDWQFSRAKVAGLDEQIQKKIEIAKTIPDNTDKFDELTALLIS